MEKNAETPMVSSKSLADGSMDFTIDGVTFKMILVAGGTFTMGATIEQEGEAFNNEMPCHIVTLCDYYIGETVVTQALWQAVMGENPSHFTGNSQYPVENVSWNDSQEFINKLNQLTGLNFRLPTEAEWEFAARGGNKSMDYKYAGSNNIGDVAWYNDNSDNTTHIVKDKEPNELGLYDMSGNVWEWCNDWYVRYNTASQSNPTDPAIGYVLRGGGWCDFAGYCRVSYRDHDEPHYRNFSLGFRLALTNTDK